MKEAVAPVGNTVVTLRSAVNAEPVAPLRFTVTGYVALPAAPEVSAPLCAPTTTVPTLLATINVSCCVESIAPFPWQLTLRAAETWNVYVPGTVAAVVTMLNGEVKLTNPVTG